jgi:hypothetical protein
MPETGPDSWHDLTVRLGRVLLVWGAGLALVFGGCGSDSEDDETTTTTTVIRVTTTTQRGTSGTTAGFTTTTRRPAERSD